jgi:hypothetical protein
MLVLVLLPVPDPSASSNTYETDTELSTVAWKNKPAREMGTRQASTWHTALARKERENGLPEPEQRP